MHPDVLISPAGPSLNSTKYGKEYYLLQHLAKQNRDLNIEAYFWKIITELNEPNVRTHSIDAKSRNTYYLKSFNSARKLLNEDVDVYHHLNFHYRFFNPLILGRSVDKPIVVGPAEPPHTIPSESKKHYIRDMTGVKWSDSTLETVLPVAEFVRKQAYNPVREKLFASTLKRSDRVVVVNNETAELYARYIPKSKIKVIPYGVVVDRFKEGSPAETSDILAIGSLYKRKGFDLLIKAWGRKATIFPDSTLHIVGTGPLRDYLEREVNELGISNSVEFHGFVERDKLVEMLASVRAFVHPSRSEGFPHVRLEAMASACPVIASNVTGTNEMIRNGIDGIVVPTGEIEPLANAIEELLGSPHKAQSMGKNAHGRAKDKFNWESIASQLNEVYLDVL